MERGAMDAGGGNDRTEDTGAGAAPEGGDNAHENEAPAAGDAPELEPGAGADVDAGAEPGAAGEDDQDPAGETDQMAGGDAIEQLQAKLVLLENQLKSRESEEREAAPAPAPMSDEQWASLEEKWGGMPRTQIQQIANQSLRVRDMVMDEVNKRMARFEKNLVMDDMAKDPRFANIQTLKEEIEEYLRNFDPAQHSNRDLLTHAYYYAKGKNADKTVRAAVRSKEANRRIAGIGRPASGAPGGGGNRGAIRLTPQQRQAAQAAGMSEQEYAKYRRK